MNEAEMNIIRCIDSLGENCIPLTEYHVLLNDLINQAQQCNEMLFIANNIVLFRQIEKKAKKKRRPVYYDELKENVLHFNKIMENGVQKGDIVIHGEKDLFYFPAIFSSNNDRDYYYFSDIEACRVLTKILGNDEQEPQNIWSTLTHAYILSLKKTFYMLSKLEQPKYEILVILMSLFDQMFTETLLYYSDVIRGDREGDKGRKRTGKLKIPIDKLQEHLKPEMTDIQARNKLTELDIKDRRTRRKYLKEWHKDKN